MSDDAIRPTFEWLITRGEGVDALVASIRKAADNSTPELSTAALLARTDQGNPGIAISLMLKRVTLHPGKVLYWASGNIHAYLSGLGIELMTSSDNVLRGGLTPKHIDVLEQLVDVLDFRPIPVPYLAAESLSSRVWAFRPDVPDFVLVRIER